MKKDDVATKRRYFAAANGFTGFRNYFPAVFDSAEYRRIFVLKGGPGTGKSSLMKKVCAKFPDGAYRTEAIFCSSDPDSLDGVIVEGKGGRVAVLDGTAPHERDAVIPGAVDEIVNLKDAWDTGALERRRAEIFSLTEEKATHYRDAYRYLSAFGKTQKNSAAENEKCDLHAMREAIRSLIRHDAGEGFFCRCRLIRAFGCRGEVMLPTFSSLAARTYLLRGGTAHKARLLREAIGIFEEENIPVTFAPSPFEPDVSDGILAEAAGVALLSCGEDGILLDADGFFDRRQEERGGDTSLLTAAKESFLSASESHFALEKIYTAAMDFSVIDRKTERIIERIADTVG